MSLTNQEKVDRIRQMRGEGAKNAEIMLAIGLNYSQFSVFLRELRDAGVEIPAAKNIGRPKKAKTDLSAVK